MQIVQKYFAGPSDYKDGLVSAIKRAHNSISPFWSDRGPLCRVILTSDPIESFLKRVTVSSPWDSIIMSLPQTGVLEKNVQEYFFACFATFLMVQNPALERVIDEEGVDLVLAWVVEGGLRKTTILVPNSEVFVASFGRYTINKKTLPKPILDFMECVTIRVMLGE